MQPFYQSGSSPKYDANLAGLDLSPSSRQLLEALPLMMWASQGHSHFLNRRWRDALGTAGKHWLDWVFPLQRLAVQDAWQQAYKAEQGFNYECRMLFLDGQYRWCLLQAERHLDAVNGSNLWWLTCTDIHQRVEAQQQASVRLKMLSDMLDASLDCIKVLDTDGRLIHINRAGREALGISAPNSLGMQWLPLLDVAGRKRARAALNKAKAGRSGRFPAQISGVEKRQSWDNILTPLINSELGTVDAILCVSRDVTSQLEAEQRLRASLERDDLTGLYNRLAFRRQLKRAVLQARKTGQSVGVLLLDLDHFKHLNDTLGHPAGDHLLQEFGQRLSAWATPNVFVSRLGGDEFALVVRSPDGLEQMNEITAQLLALLDAPVIYAGRIIKSSMSIGWAMFPRDAQDADTLMKCADRALNDLKAVERGAARMYTPELLEQSDAKLEQMNLCRVVINEQRVVPYYQPKVRLSDGALIGFEALLRWRSADAVELPCRLAEAFNHYDLASQLDEQMHCKVFSDLARWLQQGLDVVPVSVNVAPMEFLRDDYAELFLARLAAHGIAPSLIELEVTEHMLEARGAEYVMRALRLLKERGVRITLDDFGTGYSSFTRLRDYPVDCLKLDYGFVSRLEHEPHVRSIVQAITQLGPSLNLDIVAEGIECERQRELLLASGCGIGQGLLFSPALSAQEAQALLRPILAQ